MFRVFRVFRCLGFRVFEGSGWFCVFRVFSVVLGVGCGV